MATTTPRLLLPQLPPELRNQVYSYLSTQDDNSHPTSRFLPFQSKQYECKHTSITITPAHYGSNSLLTLQQFSFLEAQEYYAWLAANDLELRIKIIFKGKVNTFIQADWNKKIDVHLRKLVHQHDWLRKVAHYHVEIHWDASDGVLRGRKKKVTGDIPRNMVKAFTALMDAKVKKNSRVEVKLLLAHRIAVEHALAGTGFGLGVFLAQPMDNTLERFSVEAWKTPHRAVSREGDMASIPALAVEKSAKRSTTDETAGRKGDVGQCHLLAKRKFLGSEVMETLWGDARIVVRNGPDYIVSGLVKDC